MTTNEELLRKAAITATDALAAAGALNPEQSDRFIDFVIDVTMIQSMGIRVERFRNQQKDIDKISVGNRVSVPAIEGVDPGRRRGVTTSTVPLNPNEIMTPFEISTRFMEENIEGESVEDHVVRMMATQTGNDIETLYWDGESLGPAVLEGDIVDDGSTTDYIQDSFLALGDGWLRRADGGGLVDIAGASISPNVFSRMLNQLPVKFRKQRARLIFLCSTELEQLYRERVSARATSAGDTALNSPVPLTPFGVPLMGVPLFEFFPPVTEHVTFTGSGSTVSLRYGPIQSGSVVVIATSLGSVPDEAFIDPTDFTVDETLGTVTHAGGGSAIGATDTVKVTYAANPQILLTHADNMIAAIGRDITIERDRDIFRRMNQWAITTKVDSQFEELTAVVKAFNISSSL